MARTKANLLANQSRVGKHPRKALSAKHVKLSDAKQNTTKPIKTLPPRLPPNDNVEEKKKRKHSRNYCALKRFRKASGYRGGKDAKCIFNMANRQRQCEAALHKVIGERDVKLDLRMSMNAIRAVHSCVNADLRKIFMDCAAVLRNEKKSTLNGRMFMDRANTFSMYRDVQLIGAIDTLINDK